MKILTVEEKSIVAEVLMDSSKYKELMDDPNHPNVWALDYVYDSRLRKNFESLIELEETPSIRMTEINSLIDTKTIKLLDFVLLELDSPTKNSGRIFPKDLVLEKFPTTMFLLLTTDPHPIYVNLEQVVGKIENIRVVSNSLVGDISILDTPYGRLLSSIADEGLCKLNPRLNYAAAFQNDAMVDIKPVFFFTNLEEFSQSKETDENN